MGIALHDAIIEDWHGVTCVPGSRYYHEGFQLVQLHWVCRWKHVACIACEFVLLNITADCEAFLDMQDTRISRGDGGSVFVLVKDVSFPSNLPPSTTAIVPIADTPKGSDLPASTTAIVPIADTPQQSGVAGTPSAPAPYLSVSSLAHDSLGNKQASFCEPAATQA